jgi:hypothetical protein
MVAVARRRGPDENKLEIPVFLVAVSKHFIHFL